VIKGCRSGGPARPELLDDLIQETYLKICANGYRVLREFDSHHPDALFGLLKTVAYSVVQDHFRAAGAGKRGGGRDDVAIDETVASSTDAAAEMERGVLISEIRSQVETLELRDRRIFWMHFRDGMTSRAIASIPALALTQKGVESALARIKKVLRERMGDDSKPKGKAVETSFQLGDGA
jgi:RNA polymerase sigma-70 factor (ECF subfamily)